MLDWMACDLKQCVETGFPCAEVFRSERRRDRDALFFNGTVLLIFETFCSQLKVIYLKYK